MLTVLLIAAPRVMAQSADPLPSPLKLSDVIRLATEGRDELQAARARVRAGEARPAIASALPDPMIAPSLDHLPFMGGGTDWSITVEQQIPLSRIRGHRRASAVADLDRVRAEASRMSLDVGLEAARAYLMLDERRRTAAILGEQAVFARDVIAAANARYASGTGPQSDVLRAELEVARLQAMTRAIAGDVKAAEAMLNTSLGRDADRPVPDLAPALHSKAIPSPAEIQAALAARPELAALRAEIARADADVLAMRDMFKPMATIRTGFSSTMAEGRGWMAMAGISLPLWRDKLHAGVAEAEAMRAMSSAELRAMTRMIEGEAAAAAGELQAARDRHLALTTDVLPRARLAIDPAVASYAAGQLPLVSVIETVQALWLVQTDVIAADTALTLAWVRLARVLGSYEGIGQ